MRLPCLPQNLTAGDLMKLPKLILGCILCLIAAAALGYALLRSVPVTQSVPVEIPESAALTGDQPPVSSEDPHKQGSYLVRQLGGFIAVYRCDNLTDPEFVTEISVSHLRQADQRKLQKGIIVKNREDLLLILEDFGS